MTSATKQKSLPVPEVCEMVLRIGGEEQTFSMPPDEDNIIVAALENDIDAPYACLEGICSTCKARVIEGEVVMGDAIALDALERADGLVLACQSRPLTAKVILSFDDL